MQNTLKLDGTWRFFADEPEYYTGFPPAEALFTETMQLPGTTAQNAWGEPNPARETGFLTEVYPYRGNAWFLREVVLPEALRGERLELFLERTRLTKLWVNGVEMGGRDSLCTPHIYDLSAFSGGERLTLCICVNNVHYPTKGGHMTSPDTQTNWNGITGEIALRRKSPLSGIRIWAEREHITLRMRYERALSEIAVQGEWLCENGESTTFFDGSLPLRREADGICTAVLPLAEARLWDEYSPVLARLRIGGEEVTCGVTDFRAEGHWLTNGGRRLFLRGKHDGMVFPLTGAAPTDLASWMQVFRTVKQYGINHYRFHTCCPPEAAFAAADRLGIYLEPELPFWGDFAAPGDEKFRPEEQAWLVEEGRRILETFGHHPSFCMFSLGNELWGSPERLDAVLAYYRSFEQRILFTAGSNNFQFWPLTVPEEDFFVGVRMSRDRRFRGSYASCDAPGGHVQSMRPGTLHSYDPLLRPERTAAKASAAETLQVQTGTGHRTVRAVLTEEFFTDKPILSHEIGQYCFYPDFSEIRKYTGVLRARNFEIFRERLEAAGMAERAEDFFRCAGKLAVQCYKEELEAACRSEELSGFQLLDLQDFPGQGTALVGILNAFLENKGIIAAQEWRMFCNDSVLLGCFADYCLTDRLRMTIRLRHHRPEGVRGELRCTIRRGEAEILRHIPVAIDGQGLFTLGEIDLELPPAERVEQISITLSLPHTENRYTLWQFPVQAFPEPPEGLLVTQDPAEARAALARGERVLCFPQALPKSVQGYYCTDFWCYPMFRSISEDLGRALPVGTLGLCIDTAHPAVQGFGCEAWTTPPWYDIVSHAQLAVLDGLPVQPIVQMIDNTERNHRLGLLFECRCGAGRLLVCTADRSALRDRPEAAQFLRCLYDYAVSPAFAPEAELTAEALESVLG